MRLPIAETTDLGRLQSYMVSVLRVLKLLTTEEGVVIEKSHPSSTKLVRFLRSPSHVKIDPNSPSEPNPRSSCCKDPRLPSEERKSTETIFPLRLSSFNNRKFLEMNGLADEKSVPSSRKISRELSFEKFGTYPERPP
ncbi:hypothetical protein PR202_ga30781 [Eleusine coracana subsp. coracana]|uniref:Uncharacterized protein n=1 Tax=Eleusine coracana subsp. coracana TaxID=191504 RepID=A0AAV5DPP8_ELECO|nr:hypothetical protein PR202_ga30781 [Eleusine coracana subsp. coracana]